MTLSVITPPTTEPLSIAEVLAMLALPNTQTLYASMLLQSARQGVEQAIVGVLLQQTLLWQTSIAADTQTLVLPIYPVIVVNSVMLNSSVLPSNSYALLPNNTLMLSTAIHNNSTLQVQFSAGYASNASALPAALVLAVRQLVVALHQGESAANMQRNAAWQALIHPYKTMRLV
jgi:uncharacterized phiE125 gp8 family phage protein